MISLYVLGVDEFRPVIDVAGRSGGSTRQVGDYVEIRSDEPLVIDRQATGVSHAVWYSCIGGLRGGTVVQFDKEALRIEPT